MHIQRTIKQQREANKHTDIQTNNKQPSKRTLEQQTKLATNANNYTNKQANERQSANKHSINQEPINHTDKQTNTLTND